MDYLQTICRICESQENLCDLTNKLNENVAQKLVALTTIRIQPNDPLPRCICVECVNTLNLAYDFLLRCEAAEQKLQEEIQKQCADEEGLTVVVEVEKPMVEYLLDTRGDESLEEEDDRSPIDDDTVEEIVEEEDQEDDKCQTVMALEEERLEGSEEMELIYETIPGKYTIENCLEEEELEPKVEFDIGEETLKDTTIEEAYSPSTQPNESDGKFQCETCGASFEKCTELYQHIKNHGKARFQCKECGRWFSRRAHLLSHEVIHTGERNFQCQSCPNAYKSGRNLRRHVKSAHLGEKPFVCDLCGKEFSQKTVLEAHHSTHIQEKKFSCEVCLKLFKSSKSLKLHLVRHVRIEKPKQETDPLECDVCHKFYSSKISLRSHKQMHSDTKIACTFCGKSFKILAHLKVHLRSHTKEQPYECGECHKKFGYESSLKTHQLVHSNERPYKCDLCNVSFRQLNHLKGHRFLHSGEKPFECEVCKKTFALRGNLTIHMRTHGGPDSSPFQCRLCEGKKLNDSNAMKRHLKVHPTAKVVKMGTLTVIVEQDVVVEQETTNQLAVFEKPLDGQQLVEAVQS
ncbi:gastrula zinc finger protein XlCGF57.1-like [Toxorhynchites rutilus septentrionalis]|uniref:gastrula zinc finger protein XlCGF57.1-like n=1 Tax=Toxorhynchites rutilus septentrionalis TaxID=329112 RepID=UPI002479293B|nr:gastrula zinc finger protein XlCGF57.1-like [Toxorhynchites rutilus septentrionalis]